MSGVRGLVDRIGRRRVRELLVEFYARLAADPMVGFFFAGHDLAAIVDGQLAFLCRATGAVPDRAFRHPREAHRGLAPILRGQFDRRKVILREVLEAGGLAAPDVVAWVALEESMRGAVQARRGSSGA